MPDTRDVADTAPDRTGLRARLLLAALIVVLMVGAYAGALDGPARDYAGIVEVGLPCWCTGLNPGSPYSNGPGRVGFPVQIGGQQVETGDMIVADFDGIVVVPFDRIDDVIAMLAKVSELEAALDAELKTGLKVPQAIRDVLDSDQVKYVD